MTFGLDLDSRTPRPIASPSSSRLRQGVTSKDDERFTLLKGLPVAIRPDSDTGGGVFAGLINEGSHGLLLPPAHIHGIAPPMPDGEEYDSETEAERQVAWEEYYRMTQTGGIGTFSGAADVQLADDAYQYQSGRIDDDYLDE